MRGRSSRGAARIRIEPPRRATRSRTRPRHSVSVTFPAFAPRARGSDLLELDARAGRAVRAAGRPCPAHGRRPRRRAACAPPLLHSAAAASWSSTSASWSPGSTRRGTCAETVSDRLAPAASTNRPGRTVSHAAAARITERGTTCGLPRRSSEKPARTTSTTIALRPGFVTRSDERPEPTSAICAGVAVRPSGGRVVPAPAEAGTSTSTASRRRRRAIHRPMTVKVTVAA